MLNLQRQTIFKSPETMKKTIEIIYEDKWLVAIDKPSGLMSVAGYGIYAGE